MKIRWYYCFSFSSLDSLGSDHDRFHSYENQTSEKGHAKNHQAKGDLFSVSRIHTSCMPEKGHGEFLPKSPLIPSALPKNLFVEHLCREKAQLLPGLSLPNPLLPICVDDLLHLTNSGFPTMDTSFNSPFHFGILPCCFSPLRYAHLKPGGQKMWYRDQARTNLVTVTIELDQTVALHSHRRKSGKWEKFNTGLITLLTLRWHSTWSPNHADQLEFSCTEIPIRLAVKLLGRQGFGGSPPSWFKAEDSLIWMLFQSFWVFLFRYKNVFMDWELKAKSQ